MPSFHIWAEPEAWAEPELWKKGVSAFVWPADGHGQLALASSKRTALSRSPTLASLPFLIRRSLAGSLPSTLACFASFLGLLALAFLLPRVISVPTNLLLPLV